MKRLIIIMFLLIPLLIFSEQFNISASASVNKKEITLGGIFKLTITITAKGDVSLNNWQLPAMPNMDWARLISQFSSTNTTIINNQMQTVFKLTGYYKTLKVGNFEIKPISFHYNAPNTGTPLTIKTESIKIKVKKASILHSIKGLNIILFVIIVILIIFIVIISKKQKNIPQQDVEKEEFNPFQELKKESNIQKKYEAFEQLFREFLLDKYGIKPTMVREEIKQILVEKEINQDKRENINDILDYIYLTKYKGFTPDDEELNHWIDKLEQLSEK